jgi:hypothetical protein
VRARPFSSSGCWALDESVLVTRCRRDEALRYARESCSVRTPEVRRYRTAGRPTCRYINPRDHVRERRIEQEIVVDAYDPQGYQL